MSDLILGTSNIDYHKNVTHLSSSALKTLLADPAKFEREYILGQKENIERDVFVEGSFVHALILEPQKVAEEYAVFSGLRKQGKLWDEFKVQNPGKTLISAGQLMRCEALVNSYSSMPVALELLKDGLPEHNMVSEVLGVPMKARADFIKPGHFIVDVKTTSMPSDIDIFRQTVKDYKYQLSAALYCQIAFDTYGAIHDFYWLVLSKDDKQCHVYKASSDTLAEGAGMVTKALVLYKKCKESNKWIAEQPKVSYDTKEYEIGEV